MGLGIVLWEPPHPHSTPMRSENCLCFEKALTGTPARGRQSLIRQRPTPSQRHGISSCSSPSGARSPVPVITPPVLLTPSIRGFVQVLVDVHASAQSACSKVRKSRSRIALSGPVLVSQPVYLISLELFVTLFLRVGNRFAPGV